MAATDDADPWCGRCQCQNSTSTLYQLHIPAVYTPWNSHSRYRQMVLPLLHQPGTEMHFNYIDPLGSYARSIYAAAILSLVVVVIALRCC